MRLRVQLGDVGDRLLSITKRVYLACTEHHADASRRHLRWLTAYNGGKELARAVAVMGNIDHLVEHLSGLVEDGADELILNFVFDEDLAVEAAAHDIVPTLREQLGRQVA